jgi:prevent-host-death family protein
MNTITVSATHARNNFFDLLNQVAAGKRIIIERDKKEIAVLEAKREELNHSSYLKAARAAKGVLAVSDYNPLFRKMG